MPSNAPEYPAELESAWLQHAMRVTGVKNPRTAVERLESKAGSLSDAFTTGRDPSFAGYRNDRQSLAAYGLFFFPRAYVRTRIAVRECLDRARIVSADRPFRMVDVGAGTGAAGLACLHELSDCFPDRHFNLEMVDLAKEGILLSREVFSAGRAYWPRAAITEISGDARTFKPDGKADLIVCSFALNEWMEQRPEDELKEWVDRMMDSLHPGGLLLLLEPSLRFAVERMERLRDQVAADGRFHIVAPCPHHRACPMLAEKRGWCHEVRQWRTPDSLRWINRKLQRDIHLLKFSMLALANVPPQPTPPDHMRLVSPLRKEKGKYAFHGCGADGQIHPCEWLTRNLDKTQKEESEQLERGDRVIWEKTATLGDGVTERGSGPPTLIQRNGL